MSATLAASALLAIAAATLFALVGRRVLAWGPAPSERFARDAFATWWFGLAVMTAAGAARHAMAAAGFVSTPVHMSIVHISLLGLFGALGGLMYYLLYVYTGSRRLGLPVLLFYVGFYLWVLYVVARSTPIGVLVEPWRVAIEYEVPVQGPVLYLFLALLLVPILLGAVLYSLLYFRVRDPAQKRRVALVSFAFLAWFGTVAFASLLHWNELYLWPLASRLVGLAAAGVIFFAFRGSDPAVTAAGSIGPGHGE